MVSYENFRITRFVNSDLIFCIIQRIERAVEEMIQHIVDLHRKDLALVCCGDIVKHSSSLVLNGKTLTCIESDDTVRGTE